MSLFNPPKNQNYCATIVKIEKLVPLENCANIQHAMIFGNAVIVDKNCQLGEYGLFFPLECKLSPNFLSNNNLYRDAELNVDKKKKGFFENGRVRCVKLRGNKSEGFFIPVSSLSYLLSNKEIASLEVGNDFDQLKNELICEKYVVPSRNTNLAKKKDKKVVKRISRLIENQMRLHCDTYNLRRNIHTLSPNDQILVSNKIHGTSGVFAHLLVKRELNVFDRICKFFGANINDAEYGFVRASRNVIKDQYLKDPKNVGGGFYGYDLWEDVAKIINPCLEKGMSAYVEIFGYTRIGGYIQKDYDYRCKPNECGFAVYRLTSTNADGSRVIDFDWKMIKEYCARYNLPIVPEYFYGKAGELFDLPTEQHWHENWLAMLEDKFVENKKCDMCVNDVPKEGVVVRVEKSYGDFTAYKSKSSLFLARETKLLDDGIIDMETAESEGLMLDPIEITKTEPETIQ